MPKESRGRLEGIWERFFSTIMGHSFHDMDDAVEFYHLASGQRDPDDAKRQRHLSKGLFRRNNSDHRKAGEMMEIMREAKRRKPKE